MESIVDWTPRRGVRTHGRCALLVAIVLALVVPVRAEARHSVTIDRSDAAEGAAVDIVEARLHQSATAITVVARLAAPLDSGSADAAIGTTGLCVSLRPAASRARTICLGRAGGRWLAIAHGRTASATAAFSGRTARLSIDTAAAGLEPGPMRWAITVSPPSCDPATATPACGDRAPDTGWFAGRVWRVRRTGCDAHGSAQVSRGPVGKRIALTFDDGPSRYTPALLATLRRLHVPATFFMVGQNVAGHGALLRRMLAEGHELADHSWNHADLGGGGGAASGQIQHTQQAIRNATGYTPCLFRPPYGATGGDLVGRAHALGVASVLWTVDPHDYMRPGAGTIATRVISATRPGAIILSHDGGGPREQTLAAVPAIVSTLRRRGYRFVTVSELLRYRARWELTR